MQQLELKRYWVLDLSPDLTFINLVDSSLFSLLLGYLRLEAIYETFTSYSLSFIIFFLAEVGEWYLTKAREVKITKTT